MKTKMRFIRRFFSLLFIAGLLLACEKDVVDGPVGPQGAQGEQGEAGPQGVNGVDGIDGEAQGIPGPQGANGADGADGVNGQDGADGQNGATGTANVIYSDWIDSGFEDDITDGFDAFLIDAPEVTQEIIDTGVVMVYARSNTNVYYTLPVAFHGTLKQSYFVRINGPGSINIGVEGVEGNNNIGEPFLNNLYRYVIIPGGIPASGKSFSKVDYSKMTYEEIAERFNIPD